MHPKSGRTQEILVQDIGSSGGQLLKVARLECSEGRGKRYFLNPSGHSYRDNRAGKYHLFLEKPEANTDVITATLVPTGRAWFSHHLWVIVSTPPQLLNCIILPTYLLRNRDSIYSPGCHQTPIFQPPECSDCSWSVTTSRPTL